MIMSGASPSVAVIAAEEDGKAVQVVAECVLNVQYPPGEGLAAVACGLGY
jgi:hypothetical protein